MEKKYVKDNYATISKKRLQINRSRKYKEREEEIFKDKKTL